MQASYIDWGNQIRIRAEKKREDLTVYHDVLHPLSFFDPAQVCLRELQNVRSQAAGNGNGDRLIGGSDLKASVQY